ncbi:sugar ABC transporter substrate-binding protein [Cryobacterium sp. TMS1-20-1]|uniref:sugar ABC transporter substrate-binding protein n=1 Tax=Cryobacterium sp. TMS1-20-1 TaxID=1259223 RepID=UPI00141B7B8F|nr:sugar ABC transporter substrate-binding protein [Cryobacterium sp. TMS1-20-1]
MEFITAIKNKNARARLIAGLALGLAAVFGVTACGSNVSSPAATEDSTNAGSGTVTTRSVDELAATGLETAPPTEGPSPASGKKVWWVSCGPIAADCALPMGAAQEAADAMGIDFNTADGKLNEGGGFISALQTAIAARPDAIIVHALDCNLLKAPLREAKELGIAVLGVETTPCTGDQLFEDMIYAPEIQDTNAYFESWGIQAAEYLIAQSDGKAKVIVNEGTDSVFPPVQKGFMDTLTGCSGCEVVDTVTFTMADQVPNGPWIQRLRATLVQNPDATAVFIPSDNMSVTLGGARAAQEANPDMVVINGGSGTSSGITGVRNGDVTAIGAAHDAGWIGYAAIDSVNRLLAGEELVPEGIGVIAVDAENNLPEASDVPYESKVDWKSAYEKLWGVN